MDPLSTDCADLDALLDGGLEPDAITLVFGEGGSGKTNLALQCARVATAAGKRVAFVDTEGVSAARMEQIFAHVVAAGSDEDGEVEGEDGPDPEDHGAEGAGTATEDADPGEAGVDSPKAEADLGEAGVDPAKPDRGPGADGAEEADPSPKDTDPGEAGADAVAADADPVTAGMETATRGMDRPAAAEGSADEERPGEGDAPVAGPGDAQRVLFYTPFSIDEQERAIRQATRAPDLGLVVVDSINMHYRLHIDGGEDMEKQASRSLYAQLHHLTNFARKFQVPVLITGQVFGAEDTTQPFARRTMEHLVKALVRFEKRPDGSRRATVLKHRSIEEGRRASFRIAAHGLVGAGGAMETPPDPTDPRN